MSSSPTEPSNEDRDRIRRAQAEILRKAGIGEGATLAKLSPGALSRSKVATFEMEGGPPASIVYLHGLIARGLGDSYNFYDRNFVIQINAADGYHYATLKGVESVLLHYADSLGEQDLLADQECE